MTSRARERTMSLDRAAGNDNDDVGQRAAVTTPAAAAAPAPVPTTTGLFTAAQWTELHRQALIYEHMAASAPIPSYLLFSDVNAAAAAAQAASSYYCYCNGPLLVPHYHQAAQQAARMSMLLQCMQQAAARRRCGRTDGKKWRCARDAEPDQRYCQRHLNRAGRPRHAPPARKQQEAAAASAVDGHRRDQHQNSKSATDAGHRSKSSSSTDSCSGGGSKAASAGGLLELTGGVCLPEQSENRLSLNYDSIAELYCNKQVAATAAPSSSATVMEGYAGDHGAAASWECIGGPLGEVLGLAAEVQWPV